MAITYTPIASSVLTSNTATVSFTSFSGYQDLILRISAQDTSTGANTGYIGIRLNGTAYSSGYYRSLLLSNLTTEMSSASNAYASTTACDATNGSFFTSAEINIPDYPEAIYRTIGSITIAENDTSSARNSWGSNQVYNALAITQIEILSNTSFKAGSRFDLYGLG